MKKVEKRFYIILFHDSYSFLFTNYNYTNLPKVPSIVRDKFLFEKSHSRYKSIYIYIEVLLVKAMWTDLKIKNKKRHISYDKNNTFLIVSLFHSEIQNLIKETKT